MEKKFKTFSQVSFIVTHQRIIVDRRPRGSNWPAKLIVSVLEPIISHTKADNKIIYCRYFREAASASFTRLTIRAHSHVVYGGVEIGDIISARFNGFTRSSGLSRQEQGR